MSASNPSEMPDSHPSFFALDKLALAADRAADPEIAKHAAGCAQCSAYLENLARSAETPRWIDALEAERPPKSLSRFRLRWAVGSLALAAAAALFIAVKPQAITIDRTEKGAPSVALYIKRGERVALWDGRASLQPGDDVRLKVAGAGFTHLAVAHLEGGALTELFSGDVNASGETLLPQSWSLDNEPGPERILLVFSKAPLAETDLHAAAVQHPRTDSQWSTLLELHKK